MEIEKICVEGIYTHFAAADSDGYKVSVAVVDCLKKGSTLSTVGGAVGGIFNVAALIDRAVGAQQRRAYLVAGIGRIGLRHHLNGFFTKSRFHPNTCLFYGLYNPFSLISLNAFDITFPPKYKQKNRHFEYITRSAFAS